MINLIFFKKFIQLIGLNKYFYLMLIFGILITINSSSWIGAWIGMEVNLLSFIPLLINSNNKLSKFSNSSMIYYIIQVGASSFLFIRILIIKINLIFMNINFFMIFLQIRLILKLGASPFHWWLVKIINNVRWINCFIILTLQKIAPLFILININNRLIIYISIILSGFIGSLLGLNQTSLKLVIVYSSINHMSWIFMSILIDFYILLIYLIIYSLNNLIICIFFSYFNINYLSQVYKFNNMSYFMKFLVIIIFISIAGIPPIFGFIPKFFVFILIVNNRFFIECFIFIIFTLIVLFYYINLILPSMLYLKLIFKLNLNNLNINFYFLIVVLFNVFIILIIYFILLYFNY